MKLGKLGAKGGFGAMGRGGGAGRNRLFGVNMSGPEFAPWNGQTFPSAANWTYLASKGVSFVRLPVAWESLQTTLSSALNTTYLNNIKAAIASAKANGINTIVDIHNFAHYITQAKWTASDGVVSGYAGNAGVNATGVNALGDGTLTQAAFVDLWTRLATALVGTPGLVGYGLMNEPGNMTVTNLLKAPNWFLPGSFNDWFVQNGSVQTIQASGTNPLGAGYGPAWLLTSGSGFGAIAQSRTLAAVPHTVSIYAKTASGTQPLNFQNDGSSLGTSTVTTTWTQYSKTFTPTAASHIIGFQVNAATGNSFLIANAQLELGSSATAYVPNPILAYAQAAITAIRAIDATTAIYVGGAVQFGPAIWPQYNYELATLTGGGLVFDAHAYFDGAQGIGGGGVYSGTFTSYSVDTQTGVQALTPFTSWLTATGVTGFLGEFGIPNSVTDNNAQWLPTQVNFLNTLRAANVSGTQWFYGSNGVQPSNILNIGAAADDPRLLQMLAVR